MSLPTSAQWAGHLCHVARNLVLCRDALAGTINDLEAAEHYGAASILRRSWAALGVVIEQHAGSCSACLATQTSVLTGGIIRGIALRALAGQLAALAQRALADGLEAAYVAYGGRDGRVWFARQRAHIPAPLLQPPAMFLFRLDEGGALPPIPKPAAPRPGAQTPGPPWADTRWEVRLKATPVTLAWRETEAAADEAVAHYRRFGVETVKVPPGAQRRASETQ